MRQVRVHGPGDVRLDEVPEPRPEADDVVIRVAACGICGSDLSYIKMGGLPRRDGQPMCLGHEIAGVVEFVGSEVRSVRVGDRVVVQPGTGELPRIGNGAPEGGLTPLLLVTAADRRLHKVPDALPLDVAAFTEPLGVGMRAAEQADPQPGEGSCVFGCGPVGLAAIASLVDKGHERVVAVDLSPARRQLALDLGAQAAVDPLAIDIWEALADLHGGTGARGRPTPTTSAFIEASGAPQVLSEIIDRAAPAAHLSVVALHFAPIPVNFLSVLTKELTIRGSMEYPKRFADAIDLLARRDLSSIITHRYPLEQFPEALVTLEQAKDCGKVLITMDGSLT